MKIPLIPGRTLVLTPLQVLGILGIIIWIILGVRGVRARLDHQPRPAPGVFASSDLYLAMTLHVEGASEAIQRAVEQLPDPGPLVFVGPVEDPRFFETYYHVVYHAWPRPVTALGCGDSGERTPRLLIERSDPTVPIAGIVSFARSGAPPSGVAIGSLLTIASHRGIVEWYSFC